MKARAASTRKDLVNTRYVKVRSAYVGNDVINLDMEYGLGIPDEKPRVTRKRKTQIKTV